MKHKTNRKLQLFLMALVGLFFAMALTGNASAQTDDEGSSEAGMIALGAGIAVGIAGLGAGLAEKDIGAAAVGAVAENEKLMGKALIFIVIPETIVLFGFVIAFLLMGKM